jgi:hypothetical protein
LRGRWLAITAATVLLQFSYWLILDGAAPPVADEVSGGLIALGLALVPFVFLVLAFGSRHPRAAGAVLRAMGLFLVVGVPLAVADVVVGLVLGYALGGLVALRPPAGVEGVGRARGIAVGAGIAYLIVVRLISPGFAVFTGAVLPFTVLGLADQALEGRAELARRPPHG